MSQSRNSVGRVNEGLRAFTYGNPLYNLSLSGRRLTALEAIPPDPWPGDPEAGAAIMEGLFSFAGQSYRLDGRPLEERYWFPKGAGPAWHHGLHGFEWLRDLRAVGGDEARRLARSLVIGWLEWNALWTDITWTADLLGPRIANWVGTHDFFWVSADEGFRYCMFDSLARQTRHLARLLPGTLHGLDLLLAAKGLAYGSLCLTDGERYRSQAVKLLVSSLPKQILPDGGHVERNPNVQLNYLRHLIDLRSALRVTKSQVPDVLNHAIERMTPMLRLFRHGDGGLAVFNGSHESNAGMVEAVLTQAESRGRPLRNATFAGFQRLVGGRTVVIVDSGAPAQTGNDLRAHAGTLSFEVSVGRDRLIVNCGAHPSQMGPWRQALAATAAHSTLTLAETNSTEILDEGGLGRRPGHVSCERVDLDGATMVVTGHNGYARTLGFLHKRRLWLSEEGDDLRGEDLLEPAIGAKPEMRPFVLRFHLHPSVDATVFEPGDVVQLTLPSGGTWYFTAPGHPLEVLESVYFGRGDEAVPTTQIAMAGETPPGGQTVKWALQVGHGDDRDDSENGTGQADASPVEPRE